MAGRFDRFIADLASTPVSARTHNQYARDEAANRIRRRNLRLYLEQLEAVRPEVLLVGEAPSYRGGRLTGIAFVSETLMLAGIGTASGRVLGAEAGFRRATPEDERLSTEASATMVWGTIRAMTPLPLLWNAYPFHPFHAGNEFSNRAPTPAELEAGAPFLRRLIRLFPIRTVVAIGNHAETSLRDLGIPHTKVRHPSNGGKNKFVAGMAGLSQLPDAEELMPQRKSQIREIKEGRAMHEKTYDHRVQPAGPKAPLPTENAVRLSTVPSSATEKFHGGIDEEK